MPLRRCEVSQLSATRRNIEHGHVHGAAHQLPVYTSATDQPSEPDASLPGPAGSRAPRTRAAVESITWRPDYRVRGVAVRRLRRTGVRSMRASPLSRIASTQGGQMSTKAAPSDRRPRTKVLRRVVPRSLRTFTAARDPGRRDPARSGVFGRWPVPVAARIPKPAAGRRRQREGWSGCSPALT
jgi:hypothetical protein